MAAPSSATRVGLFSCSDVRRRGCDHLRGGPPPKSGGPLECGQCGRSHLHAVAAIAGSDRVKPTRSIDDSGSGGRRRTYLLPDTVTWGGITLMTFTIGRRELLAVLCGAAIALPLVARAQQGERMRRIGVLMSTTVDDPVGGARRAAFLQGLQQLGWIEGLARPGGNATGLLAFEYGLSGKWPELLKEIAPRV